MKIEKSLQIPTKMLCSWVTVNFEALRSIVAYVLIIFMLRKRQDLNNMTTRN